MKTLVNLKSLAILVISVFILSACNTKQEPGNSETEGSLEQLKSELRDVGQEIERLAEAKSEELGAEAKIILQKFNTNVAMFETSVEEKGEEIGRESREALENLKQEAGDLEGKLQSFADSAKINLDEFRDEINKDFSEFNQSLKEFFSEND